MVTPVQFFKCLADETRLNSVLLIHAEGELCVCELVEALGDSQPKISRHLAQLRTCGILEDTRKGQWVYYALGSSLPEWSLNLLAQLCETHRQELRKFHKKLQAMGQRPKFCQG